MIPPSPQTGFIGMTIIKYVIPNEPFDPDQDKRSEEESLQRNKCTSTVSGKERNDTNGGDHLITEKRLG
jgi:hypothetical protein